MCKVLILLLFSFSAHGTELSLQDAMSMSRSYWLSRVGIGQVQARRKPKRQKSNLLPDIEGSFTIQKNYLVNPPTGTDSAAIISADQPIINVSNWITIQARDADYVSQSCQTESDLIGIFQNVINLYFAVLTNADEDKLQSKRLTLIQRTVDLLQELTKLRLAPQADLSSAESQIYQINIQRLQIEADLTGSLNNLKVQLGVAGTKTCGS